ncbi:MAG: hypothetical protein IJ386_03660 [Clostridia bacterium]|nr:hypothetical protein [Clostridia bacterium]
MANITPAAVAEVFRSSVEFDMVITSTMDIVSPLQLSFHSDNFEALLDAGSFKKILKGIKGLDRNVRGIFEELHDAELGITIFADRRIRETPRRVIARFLNRPEYSYHENDTAELYFAVNTWLSFYGDAEISEEWEACPMCGSPMRDYVCTNSGCKTGSYVAFDAMLSFEKYLLDTASGLDTAEPELWHKIKPGSEFDRVYKKQFDGNRDETDAADGEADAAEELASVLKRVASELSDSDVEPKDDGVFDLTAVVTELQPEETAPAADTAKVIEAARSKVKSYEMQLRLEKLKDSPDFDRILEEFRADGVIVDAMTADASAFEQMLDEFSRLVSELKAETEEAARQKKLAEQYTENSAELKGCICRIMEGLASIDPGSEDHGTAEALLGLLTKAESLCGDVIRGWETGVLPEADGAVADVYSKEIAAVLRDFVDTVLRFDEILGEKLELYEHDADIAMSRTDKSFEEYAGLFYTGIEELDRSREILVEELMGYYAVKKRIDSAWSECTAELCRRRDELSGLMADRFAQLHA